MEAGVLGKTASSRCLSGSQPVSSRGVGKLRLGKAPSRALRLSGRPAQGLAGVLGWCVKGGGKVVAAFSKKGAVTLVASTAPGSVLRGIRVGSSFGTAKKRLGLRRLAAGIYRSKTGALVLVRGKRVRGLGVAQRSLGVRAVKRYLAAIDR
jgi:hypothetical protein